MAMEFQLGLTSFDVPVIWKQPENLHAYISGRSGSGKSYFLKKLILQAVNQNGLCIVFDYSSDFSDYIPPDGIPFLRLDVTSPSFSLNPLSESTGQSAGVRAQQLLSLMRSIFCFGPSATTALQQTAIEFLNGADAPTLSGLVDFIKEKESVGRGLAAALQPLELFTSLIHSAAEPLSIDLTAPGLVVLEFQQVVDRNFRKYLVDLLLQTIWNIRTAQCDRSLPPLLLVFDECQQLNWGKYSLAMQILREGRKFGIGGWFSSQWVSSKEAAAALGQAALQAHFRPDDQNVDKLAKSFCRTKTEFPQYQRLVQSMRVGQFLWRRTDGKCVKIIV